MSELPPQNRAELIGEIPDFRLDIVSSEGDSRTLSLRDSSVYKYHLEPEYNGILVEHGSNASSWEYIVVREEFTLNELMFRGFRTVMELRPARQNRDMADDPENLSMFVDWEIPEKNPLPKTDDETFVSDIDKDCETDVLNLPTGLVIPLTHENCTVTTHDHHAQMNHIKVTYLNEAGEIGELHGFDPEKIIDLLAKKFPRLLREYPSDETEKAFKNLFRFQLNNFEELSFGDNQD